MRHLEVEIFLKDGFDVFGAHFEGHHAREERPGGIIISIFDLLVNKHIPDISPLGIAGGGER
jgi:hypothetical protein